MEYTTVETPNATSDVSTTSQDPSEVVDFFQENRGMLIFLAVFQSLNAILAIFGNALVMYLVLTRPTLRNVGNIFVANLAITDLTYGLLEVVMIKRNMEKYLHPENAEECPISEVLCDIEGVAVCTLLVASVTNMAAIAVNRYVRVCKNQDYGRLCSKMVVVIVAFAIWPVSIIISLPPVFMKAGIIYNPLFSFCFFDQKNNIFEQVFMPLVGVIVPCVVIVWSYMKIYKKVKESRAKLKKRNVNSRSSDVSQQVLSRFLAFCTFMLLWMPYSWVGMLDLAINVTPEWKIYTLMWVYVSSSINPVVYGLFNNHFRKEYVLLWKSCPCRRTIKARITTDASVTTGLTQSVVDHSVV